VLYERGETRLIGHLKLDLKLQSTVIVMAAGSERIHSGRSENLDSE
jgi:hypothetical protein